MAAAGLKVPSGLSDLLSQLSPPALNQPPPYDLGELSLLGEWQLVDGIQELCEVHRFVDATITQLYYGALGGELTPEATAALERYFPDPRYRSAEFPQILLAEIVHIRSRIDSLNYREVRDGDIPLHCSTDPYRNVENDWDRKLCAAIRGAQGGHDTDAVTFGYSADKPGTVVLMPAWYRRADPASILIHEAAHLLLGLRGHPTEVSHRDPYAIQGFIAELGSLKAPAAERKYPP